MSPPPSAVLARPEPLVREYELHLTLQLGIVGVRTGRAVADKAMRSWVGCDVADAASMALGELLANAAAHATGTVQLHAELREGILRVSVADRTPVSSRLLALAHAGAELPDTDAEYGRGLAIVAAVSSRWGVRERAEGKAVWVEFDA